MLLEFGMRRGHAVGVEINIGILYSWIRVVLASEFGGDCCLVGYGGDCCLVGFGFCGLLDFECRLVETVVVVVGVGCGCGWWWQWIMVVAGGGIVIKM